MATANLNFSFERPGQYFIKSWLYEDTTFIMYNSSTTEANATSATQSFNLIFGKTYKIYCAAVRQDDYGDQSALLSDISQIPLYAANHQAEESPVYFPYKKMNGNNLFTDTVIGALRTISTGIPDAPIARLQFTGYLGTETNLMTKFTPEEVAPANMADVINIPIDMANLKKHAVVTNGSVTANYPVTGNFKGQIIGGMLPFTAQFLKEGNAAVTAAFSGGMYYFFKEPFFANTVTPKSGETQTLTIPGTSVNAHYNETEMPSWETSTIVKNGQIYTAPTDGAMDNNWGRYNYKTNFALSTGSNVSIFPHDGVSTFTNGLSMDTAPTFTDVFYVAYCPEVKAITDLVGTAAGNALIAANAVGKLLGENIYFNMPVLKPYTISTTLTGCLASASNPTNMFAGGTATLIFTANTDYVLPDTITVTGASYNWTQSTGTLVISNPTSDVSVTITAVQESTTKRYLLSDMGMYALTQSEANFNNTPFTSNGEEFTGMDGDRAKVTDNGVDTYGVRFNKSDGQLGVFSGNYNWVLGEVYKIIECNDNTYDLLNNTYGVIDREITDADITFTVNGTNFTCKDGMLWSEFIASSYNTGNAFSVSSNQVIYNGFIVIDDSFNPARIEKPTNLIDKNGTYQLDSGGSTN